jgi:hypothetical protein
MKKLIYIIVLIGLFACHRSSKEYKITEKASQESLKEEITNEVQKKDSSLIQWVRDVHDKWHPNDSMPYFILDRQIEQLLKNPKLTEADQLILNYRLSYEYYLRRFIYDSLTYRDKAFDLFFKTLDSDKDLYRSSIYFKTTPERLKKYIEDVKNAQTNKVKDSLIWRKLDSYNRLSGY